MESIVKTSGLTKEMILQQLFTNNTKRQKMPNDLPNPSINNSHVNDIYESAVLKLNELAAMNYESEYARAMTLKPHRDFINGMDTAKQDARLERDLEIAKTMLLKNFDIQTIMEITGLPENIITAL